MRTFALFRGLFARVVCAVRREHLHATSDMTSFMRNPYAAIGRCVRCGRVESIRSGWRVVRKESP